jgi:hypothetical protein
MRCVSLRVRASAHAGSSRSSRTAAAGAAPAAPPHAARESAPLALPRREALAAAALSLCAGAVLPRAAHADEDSVLTFAAIPGERWNAVDATINLPAGWARRAGSRPKTSKEVLYTDTYVRCATVRAQPATRCALTPRP